MYRTFVVWELRVVVQSKAHGLSVVAESVSAPSSKEVAVEGSCAIDVARVHTKKMAAIDFRKIEGELNGLLAGAWQFSSSSRHRYALANPVFTRQGDMVVQLIELKKA